MRLITPKRLKENEDAMWVLADGMLDSFLAPGKGEFINGFAARSPCWSSPTCSACPKRMATTSSTAFTATPAAAVGSTGAKSLAHSPLEFLYGTFSDYIDDRRRHPRDDVLTGLATATFPDGSVPDVTDVARVPPTCFRRARRPRCGYSAPPCR